MRPVHIGVYSGGRPVTVRDWHVIVTFGGVSSRSRAPQLYAVHGVVMDVVSTHDAR